MKRFFPILVFLVIALGAAAFFAFQGNWLSSEPQISSTRYDADADGAVELVRWRVGDSMALWRWDRDGDGNPELIAYDVSEGADGSIHPAGKITAWDWGGDSLLDEGEVPAAAQELLQRQTVTASLAAPPSGELALVGPRIKALVERIRDGYDDWRLSGFRMPIVGASLPDLDSLLPGARRTYRNGVHQGFDMMPGHVGVPTGYSAPVVAAKDGNVIRADIDYKMLTPQEYAQSIATAKASGSTSREILDRLRGRQVWIDHGNGIITRYCHLSGVAAGIVKGTHVQAGDIIAFVGNSGMEAGANGTRANAHLHFELWIDDRYLGEGMRVDPLRALARRILGLGEAPGSS
ncbi:MAG: M23 family metallopeptidase [Acidobacteriota bacterium]